MAGSAADCVSAYTQVKLEEMHRLLKLPKNKCPVIWIKIPRDRWPQLWFEKGFNDPVVPLLVNLHGHPLAGLLWEKHLEEKHFQLGWEKFLSWECTYYHKEAGLLLSAYVDDLKMVGRAESIAPMWKKNRSNIDLDPETALVDHVYLGCTQREKKPSKTVVRDKQELFAKLLSNQTKDSDPEAGGESALLSQIYT